MVCCSHAAFRHLGDAKFTMIHVCCVASSFGVSPPFTGKSDYQSIRIPTFEIIIPIYIQTPTPCRARMEVAERLLAFDSFSRATMRVTERLLAYYRYFQMSTIGYYSHFQISTKLLLSLRSLNRVCQSKQQFLIEMVYNCNR